MGQVHGSVISGLSDEILALAVLAKEKVGYTRSLDIKFLRPTPLGPKIEFSAECTGGEDKNVHAKAQILCAGKVTATFAWITSLDRNFYAARKETRT